MSKIRTEQIKQSSAANGSLLTYDATAGTWVGKSNVSVQAIIANGSVGSAGQVLSSNGTGIYWTNVSVSGNGSGDSIINFSYEAANNTLAISTTNGGFTANIQAGLDQAYVNATAHTDIRAAAAYSNAISYTDTRATTAYSNAVATAAIDATAKSTTAYSNAVLYTDTKANQTYTNAISYADSRAATAYTNAISYSGNAALAFANAVAYADTKAAQSYTNAISYADTKAAAAYSNAIAYSGNAAQAYANAIAYSGNAAQAYANAIAYAASNTYVNSTFAPKASPTFTGDVNVTGNLTVTGTTTYIDTTTLNVGDNIITLNADIGNTSPSESAGIEINRGSSANVALLWNETDDHWRFTNDGTTYQQIASNVDVYTAYTNAIAYAANGSNILNGTIAAARLPDANTSTKGAVVLLDSVSNTATSGFAPAMNAVKTAYDTAISANSRAASAQSAAISAYSNAVLYADGIFAPKASPAFTGTVGMPALSANGTTGTAGQVLTTSGTGTYWSTVTSGGGTGDADVAYSNAVAYADIKASDAYTNAVSYGDLNFVTYAYGAASYAPLVSPVFTGVMTISPRLIANSSTGTAGQVLTSSGTANAYWATPANAAGYAVNAYSNAVATAAADATTKAATAYSNAISTAAADAGAKADTAYSNAIAYSGNAALAYANAIAYSGNAALAYANAVANSKSYADITFAPKLSPTFTGTVTIPIVSANGSVGTAGQVLATNGSGTYWTTVSVTDNSATAYANAIAYAASNTYVNNTFAPKASPTFTGSTQINSLGVGTTASGTTGEIRATGDITAYYSDERLKEIVGSVTGALDAVKRIKTFKYKANDLAQSYGFDGSRVEIGISAQSLQEVYPELVKPAPFDTEVVDGKYVSKSGDEYLTAAYERLTVILIEAVKELADIVETKLK